MEFHANEGKKVEIEVNGEIYLRHAIKTRFVKQGESYIDLFKEYGDIGIMLPENPTKVCNEIREKLGISCMIVDANDLGQEVLGYSDDIKLTEEELKGLIKDNPTGQGREQTPLVLIRKQTENKE